jgi:hypothetical protein
MSNPSERIRYADRSLYAVGNQVEAWAPKPLRDELALSDGTIFGFTPILEEGAFQFTVTTNASDTRANERAMAKEGNRIGFPAVLAAATGLLQHVRNRSDSQLTFARVDGETHKFTASPVRPLRPEIAADAGQTLDIPPAEKQLLEGEMTAYAAELDNRFANALGLIRGDLVRWYLSSRNGRLALVGDFDPERIPNEDLPNVRSVQVHKSGVADALTDQYRVYVPKALVESLYWEHLKLRFELERNRLVMQPPLDADRMTEVEADLPLDSLPGGNASPA